MKKSGKKLVVNNLTFHLIMFCILPTSNIYAADSDDRSLNQTRQLIRQTSDRHQALDNQLEKIDRKIANLSLRIRNTRNNLKQTKNERNELQKKKIRYSNQSGHQKHALQEDIQQAYLMSRQHPLKLVMNQNQAGSIGRTLAYYDYYNRYRSKQLSQLSTKINQIESIDSQLAIKQRDLNVLLNELNTLQSTVKKTRSSQQKAIEQLETFLKQQNLKLDHMENGQKVIRNTLTKSHSSTQKTKPIGTAFAKLKGRLPLPVKGKIIKRYGSSRGGKQLKWQGLVISASNGSPVKAVAGGEIVFSDWLRGYGFLTIIDHGNGYMSLYGHNQNLLADVGTSVNQNQVIATVGNSGGYRKPALYFELRKKGKPFNPARWLARR